MQFDFTSQVKQKTDEELTEIFIHAKDYNPEFARLAEQELNDRGINIDAHRQVREAKTELDKQQLQTGKSGSPFYIVICFLLALLGGLLGIYAGYIYSESKIKDTQGQKHYVYNEETRKLGKVIMWLGIVVLLATLLKYCFA